MQLALGWRWPSASPVVTQENAPEGPAGSQPDACSSAVPAVRRVTPSRSECGHRAGCILCTPPHPTPSAAPPARRAAILGKLEDDRSQSSLTPGSLSAHDDAFYFTGKIEAFDRKPPQPSTPSISKQVVFLHRLPGEMLQCNCH